ncbi:probable protein phosphatase DDB_G0279461 [Chironomus tepperi]|uniref:probable protein phosphatase DDB_G0279461 n=1 Tax=Chironomus tepperi TaxID=113505 RepID=UPI00391F4DB6
MNEPPKKPFVVKKCIQELAATNKNKQARVTHRDKEYEKCRQYRDSQCLATKNVLLENQKLQYNNSFKPQKILIGNYDKSFAAPSTKFNATSFKLSTANKHNDSVASKKALSINDNEVCQKSENLQNVPRSLFKTKLDNNTISNHTGNTTFNDTKMLKSSTIRTSDNEKDADKSNKKSFKMTKRNLSSDRKMSSNDKPQEVNPISRQYTFDSGFDERMDTRDLNSYAANPMESTNATSPNIIKEDTIIDNLSFNEDPILGQAMQVPNFDEVELNSNVNFPNSSSTPVNVSIIEDISAIIQKENSSSILDQAQDQTNGPENQNNSIKVHNNTSPNIYEKFTISVLPDSSSILKLSNNSSIQEDPQNNLARQSSFNENPNNSDFGTFVAKQEKLSRNFSLLPVIALRDFSQYHDINIDKDNEILVRLVSVVCLSSNSMGVWKFH